VTTICVGESEPTRYVTDPHDVQSIAFGKERSGSIRLLFDHADEFEWKARCGRRRRRWRRWWWWSRRRRGRRPDHAGKRVGGPVHLDRCTCRCDARGHCCPAGCPSVRDSDPRRFGRFCPGGPRCCRFDSRRFGSRHGCDDIIRGIGCGQSTRPVEGRAACRSKDDPARKGELLSHAIARGRTA